MTYKLKSFTAITYVFLSVLYIIGCKEESKIVVINLSCEYLTNPKGIDKTEPQLSWQLISDKRGQKQTAYQILVASSASKLDENTGNLCKLITGGKSKVTVDGKEVKTKSNKDGSIEFETIKGKTYKVVQL